MKKNIFAIATVLFVSFTLFSCSSDKDEPTPENDPKELLNYPYSTLSDEDQKKKLSGESEAVLKQIEGLPSEKSVKLLTSFGSINSGLFDILGETTTSDASADAVKAVIKLSKYFGEYTWNADKKEWVKSDKEVKDKLILNFPAIEGGKANNGKIEVTAITSTVVIDEHEIPSNVVANLFVSDKKEGEITAIATGINETNYVETADINVTLGAYKLVVDIDKKAAKNEAKVEFTKENNVILNAFVDLEANITAAMLDKQDISSVKDGNALAKITNNLAAAGYVDGKSLAPELQRIEKELDALYDVTGNEFDWAKLEKAELELKKARVKALNSYTNLGLVSTTEEYKVAKITFDLEVQEYQSNYYAPQKDENGNIIKDEWGNEVWVKYPYTAYETNEINILHFNDNTKVDSKVFFGKGFEKVINMWQDIIAEFN